MTLTALALTALIAQELIKPFEGYREESYWDTIGRKWTVCWGHTETAEQGRRYTGAECQALLNRDVAKTQAALEDCLGVEVTPGRKAALISWAYNVGTGAACRSTLVRQVRRGAPPETYCKQLKRWIYANNKPRRGLVKRRQREYQLCVNPTHEDHMPTVEQRNKILSDGATAARALEDPAIASAFTELEEAATEKLLAMTAFNSEAASAYFHHIKALRHVRQLLHHRVDTARAERFHMEQERAAAVGADHA